MVNRLPIQCVGLPITVQHGSADIVAEKTHPCLAPRFISEYCLTSFCTLIPDDVT